MGTILKGFEALQFYEQATLVILFIGVMGMIIKGLWTLYAHKKRSTLNNRDSQDKKIIDRLLTDVKDKEQQVKELEKTIQALRTSQDQPKAQEALAFLEDCDTSKAEQFFQAVLESKKEEGRKFYQEAAAAARHIGSLAFLHDTQKALQFYTEATQLDPNDPSGWNQLGHLLDRTGDLSGAENSCRTVLKLGKKTADQEWVAIAYGNLGTIYQTRGDLERAVEMYEKALEINQTLGHNEGMAIQYTNLGIVYQTRGDLERAVEMYEKSLEIEQALGRKEGMATDYTNLGLVYQTRGDLERAVELYKKALSLSQEVGAKPQILHVQGLLKKLSNLRQ